MSKPTTLDQAFEEITDEMLEMFLKKHKDYGKGNILSVKELGIAMRLSEKVERVKHLLMTNNEPENETMDETWVDIAVYAVIALLLSRGHFEKLNVAEDK